MKEIIKEILKKKHKKKISLKEVMKDLKGSKKDILQAFLELDSESFVKLDDPHNPLFMQVDLNKLRKNFYDELRRIQLKWQGKIDLTWYFSHQEKNWIEDKIYLQYLFDYIKNGYPKEEASFWERSFAICQDEKWLNENHGTTILKRVGLLEKMKLSDHPEPLMYALNPSRINDKKCYHLIVENKMPYIALSDVLPQTPFLTVIYGGGKRILGNALELEKQLHLEDREHILYYFGDIDWEGIKIYHLLQKIRPIQLAWCFYKEVLLEKPINIHKRQMKTKDALNSLSCNNEERILIERVLNEDKFWPQEVLNAERLKSIILNYDLLG